MKKLLYSSLALALFSVSCSPARRVAGVKDDGKIEVNFLQINDVYEIAPLSGGKEGGMARVATIKKQLLAKNPNTYLVIAGDFLSPSVYNSLQYDGKAIRGKQMVDAMNTAGLNIAMFGNHEFDIKESELQERINESKFDWVSSNTFHKVKGMTLPFIKQSTGPFPTVYILPMRDADGTTARIGILAVTLPFNKADYVTYTDALSTAKEMYNRLKDSVDAVVAITHQPMADDEKLAAELPGLAAIIGGHEHDQRFNKTGNFYITKALANAKSAYVVKLKLDKKHRTVEEEPELIKVDENIPLDSATNVVVQRWTEIANKNYSSLGFDAKKVMISSGEPLDGREVEVRKEQTGLTKLVVASMLHAAPTANVALLNGGSIRVDDILYPPITQYDILRSLPFGGGIKVADMKGSLLLRALDAGRKNIGTGGFLQYNENLQYDVASGKWILNGAALDPEKIYTVAISDFLFTGKEANLDFLTPDNPNVVKVYEMNTPGLKDIRMAVVEYLEK
jgi:2',3'-cyclic-nucleotide 2'-phosphodiesterase (5'-nucleotidase family)